MPDVLDKLADDVSTTTIKHCAAIADAWARTCAKGASESDGIDRVIHQSQQAAAEGIARLIRQLKRGTLKAPISEDK